jgi:glutathione S-transferase
MSIKLYNYELSVNCYKQRLFMGILDVDYEAIPVDFYPGWEHKSEPFLEINPLGHIPVLDDAGFIVRDAHAILIYLAAKFDPSDQWYPTTDPQRLAQTAQWLLFCEGTTNTASAARLNQGLFYDFDLEEVQAGAHRLFRVADEHLWFAEQTGDGWLVPGDHPTIADLALFPDVILSSEGGVSRQDYPALHRWTDRVKRIPGFSPMPGVFHAGPATDRDD